MRMLIDSVLVRLLLLSRYLYLRNAISLHSILHSLSFYEEDVPEILQKLERLRLPPWDPYVIPHGKESVYHNGYEVHRFGSCQRFESIRSKYLRWTVQ